MIKTLVIKPIYTVLLFSIFLICSFSSPTKAAGEIFHIEAATSAWHNPNLPSLPNPYAALTLLTWDIVAGTSQIKQSNWNHGGGWLAFVVYTNTNSYSSLYFNQQHLNANYNGINAFHFGTYYVGTSRRDIYYGPFAPKHTFKATLPSYVTPVGSLATMYMN